MRSIFAACLWASLVIAGGLALPGCRPVETRPFATETNDPHFENGKKLQRAGRTQEALEAYLKVIDKRGGDAPESHFECGLIYLQHLKDPVAAIYHLQRYLGTQRSDSPPAARTRDLIDTAKKEFARTLPAEPFGSQMRLLDLMETVDRLTKENFQLKEQIAQLRGVPLASRPLPVASPTSGRPAPEAVEPEAAPAVPIPTATRPPGSGAVSNSSGQAQTPVATPPAVSGRVHVVQKSESLYSISRQYYGNPSRVNDIVAANRGLLQDRNTPLKIGMQLKLP